MACGTVILLTIFSIICAFISVNANTKVIDLNEDNWTDMLQREWMVEFYAPWCPACKGLQNTWRDFATWSKDLGINVAKVDVTTSPGLSGRFIVTALPTIFHVINGEFRQYKGTRDKDSFMSFIEDRKWKMVEPVPGWKSPNTLQMSVVSAFFKLSQVLRQFHNTLMEEYGLPSWGSYLIFAIATIVTGALLGLVLVCCVDLVNPKYSRPERRDGKGERTKEKDSDEELDDDDIKDDLLDDGSISDGELLVSETDSEKIPNSIPSSPNVKKRKSRKE